MKTLAILIVGVMAGAVGLMLFPPKTVEAPGIHETATQDTVYRPNITTESVRSASPSKGLPSVVGEWKHDGSIREVMGESAHKYKDVHLQSELLLLKDGSFFDRTTLAYHPKWTYFQAPFGLTYVYSGDWTLDTATQQLVLDAVYVHLIEVQGDMNQGYAESEVKDFQKKRTMTIESLDDTQMVSNDGSFDYDYRRVPRN